MQWILTPAVFDYVTGALSILFTPCRQFTLQDKCKRFNTVDLGRFIDTPGNLSKIQNRVSVIHGDFIENSVLLSYIISMNHVIFPPDESREYSCFV